MSHALIVANAENALAIGGLVDAAMDYAKAAKAANTRRTYANGWQSFNRWCASHSMDPISAPQKEGLIALWAADAARSGRMKVSTIETYLAAICSTYRERGVAIDTHNQALLLTLTGIKKSLLQRPLKKNPILTEDIREMVEAIEVSRGGVPRLIGLRDRALLLLGFAGAFRRSELAGLCVEDLRFERDGFKVIVRKSKTDQTGQGMEKVVPYGANAQTCPVRAMRDWLEAAGISSGAVFRSINKHGHLSTSPLSGFAVGQIIKRNAHIQAKDPSLYGGHSLRAGFITQAAMNDVPLHLIMKQSGQRTVSVVMGYIRSAEKYEGSAAARVGL